MRPQNDAREEFSLPPRLSVRTHETQRLNNKVSKILSFHNRVEHPVVEQKLGALKTFRQFLSDGLFYDSWTRKSDLRSRFGDVQIAEHREARGYAAGCRIGQH